MGRLDAAPSLYARDGVDTMSSILGRSVKLLIAAGFCASAFAQTAATVRVGSKIDTEGKLLGHMMVLALEANGIKT